METPTLTRGELHGQRRAVHAPIVDRLNAICGLGQDGHIAQDEVLDAVVAYPDDGGGRRGRSGMVEVAVSIAFVGLSAITWTG